MMKRIGKISAVVIAVIAMFFSVGITAFAAEKTQDGLVATITSDKESYSLGEEIKLNMTVKNTNDFDVENVSLEALLPDGIELKNEQEAVVTADTLKSGESLSLDLIAVESITEPITNPTEATKATTDPSKLTNSNENTITSNNNTNTNGKAIINTGSSGWLFVIFAIFVVSIAVFLIAYKYRKKAAQGISVLLCICMVCSAFVAAMIPAGAENDGLIISEKYDFAFSISNPIYYNYQAYIFSSQIDYSIYGDVSVKIKDQTLSDITMLNNNELPYISYSENGDIKIIAGCYTDYKVDSEFSAINSLKALKSLIGFVNPLDEFKVYSINETSACKYYNMQQYYKDIPVENVKITVAAKNGYVTSYSGNYKKNIDINTIPNVTEEQLRKKENITNSNTVELVVYEYNDIMQLAYKVTNFSKTFYYSAYTGEMINYKSNIKSYSTISSGENLYGETVKFNTIKDSNSKYYMIDTQRQVIYNDASEIDTSYMNIGKNVSEIDYFNRNIFSDTLKTYNDAIIINSVDNTWHDKASNTLADNLSKVIDYYRSIDKNSSKTLINAYTHFDFGGNAVSLSNNNEQYAWMLFGSDDNFAGALDIVAHEYTHIIIEYICGLGSKYEVGALNEGYADILGNFIENDDDPNWLVGEKLENELVRNMSDPLSQGNPAFYYGTNYYTGDKDDGGVHTNCNVISHCAYLMWYKGIYDKNRLFDLWYNSLFYLQPESNFSDCRTALIASAIGMNCSQKEMEIIKSSFDEVGIYSFNENINSNGISSANLQNGGVLSGQEDNIYYINGNSIYSRKTNNSDDAKVITENGVISDLNISGDNLCYLVRTDSNESSHSYGSKAGEVVCLNLKTGERTIIDSNGNFPVIYSGSLYYLSRNSNYFTDDDYQGDRYCLDSDELYDMYNYNFSSKSSSLIKENVYTLTLNDESLIYGKLRDILPVALTVPIIDYYDINDNRVNSSGRMSYYTSYMSYNDAISSNYTLSDYREFTYEAKDGAYVRTDQSGNTSKLSNIDSMKFLNGYSPFGNLNYVYYNADIVFYVNDNGDLCKGDYSTEQEEVILSASNYSNIGRLQVYNNRLYAVVDGELIAFDIV